MSVLHLKIPTPKGDVSAVWHPADGPALVVGHGAGAGMDHPFIVGFCEAVADEGIAALRFNFPYMEAGRRTPDAAKNAIGAFRSAFETAGDRSGGRPVLGGGKSYGGRIASMAAAEGIPAAALIFLGYPLHAPGKTGQIRDTHLYDLTMPMLFLHGTKDPFAEPKELAKVIGRLGDRATLVDIDGAGHSFERSRKDDPRVVGASLAPQVAAFVRERL
ncbi:MAG: dienelactone hydrolase [Actinobacteria bacterium]|nr:MAG: dienelactone hydrolase [Actinomycetota bacterium]